jgi:hypothetical protein
MATLTVTEQITTSRDLEYVPCLQCGSTDIQFFDYGYTEGNSGGGKCKSCGAECTRGLHWDAKKDQQVAIWNSQNDPKKLIEAQEQIIQAAKDRIKDILAQQAVIAALVAA